MGPTYVVDQEEIDGSQPERVPCSESHASLLDDSGWYRGILLLPDLNADESDGQDRCKDQEDDHSCIAPGILGSSPLKANQEAYDRR